MLKSFRNLCSQFRQASASRLRIIGFSSTKAGSKIQAQVLLVGMKAQLPIVYQLEEIMKDASIMGCFSPRDRDLLAFLSACETRCLVLEPSLVLIGQEFINDQTLVIFSSSCLSRKYRRLAMELYMDFELLRKFSVEDLVNIVSAAIQEQALEDFL